MKLFSRKAAGGRWAQGRRGRITWRKVPWRNLPWRGLFALLVGGAWIAFGCAWWLGAPARNPARYNAVAARARATRDFATVRVACLRLLASGQLARAPGLFELAQAAHGLGRAQEAAQLLQLAAPLARPGYAPAHLQLAQLLLGGTNPAPQELRDAETHLKHGLALEPDSLAAHALLGSLYFRTGQRDLATKYLTPAAAAHPKAAVLLALLAKDRGDANGAHLWAERAVQPYRDRVKASKVDGLEDRLGWAQSLVLLERPAEAARVLEEGRKLSGSPDYDLPLGGVYAAWAKTVARDQPADLASRIRLVEQGLRLDPRNRELLRALLDLTQLQGAAAAAARETVARLLTAGGPAALLHFMLGTDAWQRGQTDAGRTHLRLAFEAAPGLPIIANNMAAMLGAGTPADWPRALDIIQPVVEKDPANPYFRDTRGMILAKLGRWAEAVQDLEFSLPQTTAKRATHEVLAQAYRGLGLPDMAARHERLAKEAPAEPATPPQPPPAPGPLE